MSHFSPTIKGLIDNGEEVFVIGSSVAAVGLLGTVLLTGVLSPGELDGDSHGRDSAAYIRSLTPVERVEHDFAGPVEPGDDCLQPTGYDPLDYKKYGDSRRPYNVGAVSLSEGIIRIIPAEPDKGGPILELRTNNGTAPLQPATPASAAVLKHFGCELEY